MNMLVCVKQVPDTTEIKIDPVKNTLIRAGVPSILNPFDAYALEAAARIKDQNPNGKIIVVSMGPPQAMAVLRESISIAADGAYLVSSRFFGGSDTLATSYILTNAIKAIEEKEGKFDIIFCGKQAIDGDTAQVGPEIAEQLDLPQVTYALSAEMKGDLVHVTKETEEGAEVVSITTPCLLTFSKPEWEPRFPNLRRMLDANKLEIPVLSEVDFPAIDMTLTGLKGSPTKVKKSFVPPVKTGGTTINEATAQESAKKLFQLLADAGTIS